MGKIITNGFKLTLREASTGKDAGDTIYDFQRVGT